MAQINILSSHVADLIAAGEVVEKPSNAVKELLENAFDAQARSVSVEIRNGGREIRVTDDGAGMSAEDAGICCLRHATSKLSDERGLEAIATMGFRGEALAAISSVSRMSITTRQKGSPMGVRVELTAGEIDSISSVGCREGTVMEVRDLFYNTPARQKFLGSDRAEGTACVQTALRSAMGRPELSVRCIKDGIEQFFTPGDGKLESCVYALLGRETALNFLSVESSGDIACRGFISSPEHGRGNRTAQYFFCNGRPIRSQKLSAALEQAYKNRTMVGKFPACVLYLTLTPSAVDVNVHPTKSEVRFADEKAAFDAVYYAALSALDKEDKLTVPVYVPSSRAASSVPLNTGKTNPRPDFFRNMSASEFRGMTEGKVSPPQTHAPVSVGTTDTKKESSPLPFRKSSTGYSTPKPPMDTEKNNLPVNQDPPNEQIPEQQILTSDFSEESVRYIGEVMRTYILMECGDKLLLIDKHAAHERMLFDRLRLWEQPLMAQELLLSISVKVDAEAMELWEQNSENFSHLGFECEPFGEDCILLRAVPADIDASEASALFEELLEKLRDGRSLSLKDVRERLAETVACKAAVKSGWQSEPEELQALATRVLSGEVKYCPHGRPVAVLLTRQELDKRFNRIV